MTSTDDRSVYGFSLPDAQALVESIGTNEQELLEGRVRPTNARFRHAVTPSGGIPAKSGSTMGSASCTVYKANSSGVLSTTSTSRTIYNPSTTAVAGSVGILWGFDDSGLAIVIVESCA